jgi:hypothetical protein
MLTYMQIDFMDFEEEDVATPRDSESKTKKKKKKTKTKQESGAECVADGHVDKKEDQMLKLNSESRFSERKSTTQNLKNDLEDASARLKKAESESDNAQEEVLVCVFLFDYSHQYVNYSSLFKF